MLRFIDVRFARAAADFDVPPVAGNYTASYSGGGRTLREDARMLDRDDKDRVQGERLPFYPGAEG